jgi:hydroxypyruvate isomerase
VFELSAYLNLLFESGPFPDRVERVAATGYGGVEVYGFDRDLAAIAEAVDAHDLEWVYLSGPRPDLTDPAARDAALESVRESIALAETHGVQHLNVKAGTTRDGLDRATQRESVVEVLRAAAPVAAEAGVTLVLEPLNSRVDHPEAFLTTASEGADVVRAVDSPAVQLLFDCYHEQIMHGDVVRSFRAHADVVGHVHVADNPGRHQPGTGELDYATVFDAIAETGYDGFVGCEFTPTAGTDPERALRDVAALR